METLKIVVITVLCSLCGVLLQEVVQPEGFKTAKLGQTVDIKCLSNSNYKSRVWYKLSSNRRLQLLKPNAWMDHPYSVNSLDNEFTLTIKDITVKDIGTYFCGISFVEDVVFGSGTVLVIEGESEPVQFVLQSPEYIRAKPGDSVTLSCSFTSRHCPQEHISVVWVRGGSAFYEIVSSDHGKKIFCESSSCVQNLTLKNISSAEDGTYLCVVTVCGDIMIGTGTRIQLNDVELVDVLSPAVMALIGSNAVLGLVVLLLLWGMWRVSNNKTELNSEQQRAPHSNQPDDTFTYAAGSLDSSTTVRRRKHPDIYSQVCYHHCK